MTVWGRGGIDLFNRLNPDHHLCLGRVRRYHLSATRIRSAWAQTLKWCGVQPSSILQSHRRRA